MRIMNPEPCIAMEKSKVELANYCWKIFKEVSKYGEPVAGNYSGIDIVMFPDK